MANPNHSYSDYHVNYVSGTQGDAMYAQSKANADLRNSINSAQKTAQIALINLNITHAGQSLALFTTHKNEDLILIAELYSTRSEALTKQKEALEAQLDVLEKQLASLERKTLTYVGQIKASMLYRGFNVNTNLVLSIEKDAALEEAQMAARIVSTTADIAVALARITELLKEQEQRELEINQRFESRELSINQRVEILNQELTNANNIPVFQETVNRNAFGKNTQTSSSTQTLYHGSGNWSTEKTSSQTVL